MTGDSISTLQVDANGTKPTNVDSFYMLLDKLTEQPSKESFATSSSSASSPWMQTLKMSALVAVLVGLLSLPQAQALLNKRFEDAYTRTFVMSGVVFILTFLIIRFLPVS